jgi:transcription-repair coupling factor (superfamily II helicase)
MEDLGYETYQKILKQAVVELRNEEFQDLQEDQIAEFQDKANNISHNAISDNVEFVDDCTIESDLQMYFPDSYVPGSSERMLLYRELDGLELDKDVLAFKERLEDRFGKVPSEGQELLRIVPLRRLAKRVGAEKVFLKAERMTLFFVSDPDSPFYQSMAFGKVIAYMGRHPRFCNLREVNGRRSMVVKNVSTVEMAVSILQEIVSME